MQDPLAATRSTTVIHLSAAAAAPPTPQIRTRRELATVTPLASSVTHPELATKRLLEFCGKLAPLMLHRTDDLRIQELRPLIPPAILMEELPVGEKASTLVWKSRAELGSVIGGQDDRLIVVVGPARCTTRSPRSTTRSACTASPPASATTSLIVMRVYFEKPRTTVGWKG
jgi:hypothetical protein